MTKIAFLSWPGFPVSRDGKELYESFPEARDIFIC